MATEKSDNGVPQAGPPVDYEHLIDGRDPAYKPVPKGGKSVAWVDAQNWTIVDQPGVFKLLGKKLLNIEEEYQRTSIVFARVNRIAAQWSWQKFGCLSVAQRADGTYYVTDGQHRKLGADKRADIDQLPCIVFKTASLMEEAKQFLAINCDRGSVKAIDKYRSMVMCGDPAALAVDNMVRRSGYQIGDNKDGKSIKNVRCAFALIDFMGKNSANCTTAWTVCTLLCGDEYAITDGLFRSLFYCENHMIRRGAGSIADNRNIERLMQVGHNKIVQEISNYRSFHHGRPSASTQAVIDILNKGRRNRIPSALADAVEE